MRCLLHLGAGAFLLAAAVLLRPASADDAAHPLDPDATPGVLPTDDPFQGYVPLLGREAPSPSFVMAPPAPNDGAAAEAAEGATLVPSSDHDAPAIDHVGMKHAAYGGGAVAR